MYSNLILEELLIQRLGEAYCDVILGLGPGYSFVPIKAHACILVAASGFFHEVLKECSLHQEINLLETKLSRFVRPETLQRLLPDVIHSMYTGEPPKLESEEDMALFKAFEFRHLSPPELNTSFPEMEVSFCQKCHILFTSLEEFQEHQNQNCLRKITCRTCGKMFSRVQHLLGHLLEAKHGELICSICSFISESQRDLESHIKTHALIPEKPYFCLQCDLRFASRKSLINHLPKHSSDTPHVCHLCGKGFKWKHSLTSHIATRHSGVQRYQCEECGLLTSHANALKSHKSKVHSGYDKLPCPIPGCSFQTIRKDNLTTHIRSHGKDKPYQCELCGKAFSLSKNMRRHKAVHHDANPPSFKCSLCSYCSPRSDKYIEHIRRVHPGEKDKIVSQSRGTKENTNSGTTSTFTHIFEPIGTSQMDSDPFVESARVVSSLTENIDNVLLTNNI